MATGYTNLSKKGPSFDYYKRVTVTWTTFGNDGYSGDGYNPTCVIPFSSQGLMFVLETASSVVEVSFDGINTHLRLDSGVTNGVAQKYQFDNRVNSLIWLKLISGSSPIVQVVSWGIR